MWNLERLQWAFIEKILQNISKIKLKEEIKIQNKYFEEI